MIYLLLSILASTLIFVIFRLFPKYKINTLQAIVVNYFVACFCGIISYKKAVHLVEIPTYSWFYFTLGLGALFIIVFNLMALTTQRSGISVVSVATKMAFVIPIIFGLLYYHEKVDVYKGLGMLLALLAVYLASAKNTKEISITGKHIILPLLVFLGSGIIDTSINFLQNDFIEDKNVVPLFSATIFSSAAIIGVVIITYQRIQKGHKFESKSIIAGIVLGVPNYFSIYFLVKALQSSLFDSSGIFTINNVAIVVLSTVIGILFFQEKLNLKNWIGMALAIISITLVTLATH